MISTYSDWGSAVLVSYSPKCPNSSVDPSVGADVMPFSAFNQVKDQQNPDNEGLPSGLSSNWRKNVLIPNKNSPKKRVQDCECQNHLCFLSIFSSPLPCWVTVGYEPMETKRHSTCGQHGWRGDVARVMISLCRLNMLGNYGKSWSIMENCGKLW